LQWLGSHHGPAPRLLAAGTLVSSDLAGRFCLVCDRAAGVPPTSSSAWTRLGEAVARLASLPWRGSALTVWDHRDFLDAHQARVRDLSRELGSDLGERLPPVPSSYSDSPLSLTHGDPGPGNFLDDGALGVLIDWEDAHVAPRGLDLGRASFIALLGAGPEGFAARDQQARADAVVAGYVARSEDRPAGEDETAWWIAVAAVQFAHRRLVRAGEPGVLPWRDPLAILALRSR
jgi:aminoglycoside phosphotransferase (APT) family kinase protein